MTNIRVCIDTTRFYSTSMGAVGGPLWIEVGEFHFPQEGWVDLPVRVLSLWADEVRNLADGTTDSAELLFMDGPYEIKLSFESSTTCRLECRKRKYSHGQSGGYSTAFCDEDEPQAISTAQLIDSLSNACSDVLELCDVNDWKQGGYDKLRAAYASLLRASRLD